jgi:hypothetical protein
MSGRTGGSVLASPGQSGSARYCSVLWLGHADVGSTEPCVTGNERALALVTPVASSRAATRRPPTMCSPTLDRLGWRLLL